MQMWAWTLAAVNVMFTLSVISISSQRPFGGAPAFRGSKILRFVSSGHFAGPGCSATMDLSNAPPLTIVGTTITGMVLIFLSTMVHCCTGSVLAPNAVTDVMLERRCVEVGVYATAGRGARGVCLAVACYLWICLSTATAASFWSKIIEGQSLLLGRSM